MQYKTICHYFLKNFLNVLRKILYILKFKKSQKRYLMIYISNFIIISRYIKSTYIWIISELSGYSDYTNFSTAQCIRDERNACRCHVIHTHVSWHHRCIDLCCDCHMYVYVCSDLPAHPCKTRVNTVQTLIRSRRNLAQDGGGSLESICLADKQRLFTTFR